MPFQDNEISNRMLFALLAYSSFTASINSLTMACPSP